VRWRASANLSSLLTRAALLSGIRGSCPWCVGIMLTPPKSTSGGLVMFNTQAPQAEWSKAGSYDSWGDCESDRQVKKRLARVDNPDDEVSDTWEAYFLVARCVFDYAPKPSTEAAPKPSE
jgi:hypothetical protein